ncbi:hypothetical protein ACHAXR_005843 [Thalassiosira sp. AJA248-18]
MKDSSSASERTITDAIAGAAAGTFARTALAPVDRVKLLIQLRGSIPTPNPSCGAALSGNAAKSDAAGARVQHKSSLQIFRGIIQKEGMLSLWRGNTPTILIEGGSTALSFVFLNWFKLASHNVLASLEKQHPSLRQENGGDRKRRLLQSFVSGGLAGATTISFLYPLGFMRTRLATDVGTGGQRMYPAGMRDVMSKIWNTDGVRGFYKGYGIALISVSMHRIVYLGGYDFIKSEYYEQGRGNGKHMSLTTRFAAAQFVSMSASTLHYPLDCVRRRLMMEAGKHEHERKYRNTLHCLRRIWTEEGYRGFYLGLGPNLVRCIGSALVLVSYDEFKKILTKGCYT